MTLTEKIAELRSAGFPIRYVALSDWQRYGKWDGQHWQETTTRRESHGGSLSYSDVHDAHNCYCGSGFIPHRAYVDLSAVGKSECQAGQSTTLDRSNYRSLIRDYPDVFTPTRYSNVDALGAYAGNLPAELVTELTGLRTDYPVYDEQDMSELESDEITESYEQYARADVESELDDQTRDMWDALESSAQESLWWQAAESADYPCEHDGYSANWDYAAMASALHDALETYFLAGERNPAQTALF